MRTEHVLEGYAQFILVVEKVWKDLHPGIINTNEM